MHELAAALIAADPITARDVGAIEPTTGAPTLRLPATDPDHYGQVESLLTSWVRPTTSPEGSLPWLEERCIQAEVCARLVELRVARPWARAPYWYVEALGGALAAVDERRLPDNAYAQAYLELLVQGQTFLTEGTSRLGTDDVPRLWAHMALPAVQGLRQLVDRDLSHLTPRLPSGLHLRADELRAELLSAVETFAKHCQTLSETGTARWAVGEDVFTQLLHDYHGLDLTSQEVWEQGWASVERAEQDLNALAHQLDESRTWQEQIETLKTDRTPAREFVTRYRSEVDEALRMTRLHDLLTVPPDQECVVATLPEYRRAGLPLGEMRTVAPYADQLTSYFYITTPDPHATREDVVQHERDNCPAFIRSIVGHETYPGHHLQSVHHVHGTDEDSFLRFFRSPLFVEGWGLYVEDLLEERVVDQTEQALFSRRNRLWRSLRLVIDTGLHTGRLSHSEAIELLMTRTNMGQHMAAGEVNRYTRHDNATYPSTYVLGRDLFHELRQRLGAGSQLGRAHDAMLSHGSPPVGLLASVLSREATA